MLTPYKSYFRKVPETVARLFMVLGFSPNGVTLLFLALGLLTSLFYVWNKNAVLFGSLLIVFGLFDSVDGALARISNQSTKFGSYLDAMSDRVYEAGALLATGYVTGYWVLCFLLLVGATMISYAKARAAMEIQVSNTEWPDFMERTERDLIFAIGMILWGIFPRTFFGQNILYWTLLLLNLAVYATLVQRILRARHLIMSRQ